ncbi:MAG TPA: flagellar basal body rod protein FlgC [Cyanobacteria bacterium UBA8530]|nr:flagellar basal body rod protein FlgC [Cyanobacteria bacterium UBA8530]
MSIFNAIDTSASALSANRLWLEVIANNLANANTTRTAEGGPYKRQMPVFQSMVDGMLGVKVATIEKDSSPPSKIYRPGDPDADAQGFVLTPNVNVVSEMVDMMAVNRAYEANVTLTTAAKNMTSKSLEIGR